MKNQKKNEQLGMNYSTASNRLVKDLLFNFIVKANENICYRCGEPMSRDTFSIEHKTPWLDSEDPLYLYFSLDNIAYSHLSCNVKAARKELKSCGTAGAYARGCRCDLCKKNSSERAKRNYTTEKRKLKYIRSGY